MIDIFQAHREYYSNIYRYRNLIWVLARRELAARYKGSFLGFLWTFLNPLLLMGTYTVVFSNMSRFQIPDYPLFILQGILVWQFFAGSVSEGSQSIMTASGLVTKTPMPPEIIPCKTVLAQFLNFAIAFSIYFIFAIFVYKRFSSMVLIYPVFIAALFVFSNYVAATLGILSAIYKDVHQLVGNILTILFFATPVIYSFDDMPEKVQRLLLLNPVAQVFRVSTDLVFWGKLPAGSAITISLFSLFLMQLVAVLTCSWFRRRLAESL